MTSFGLVYIAIAGTGLTLAGLAAENVNLGLHSLGAPYGIVCLNMAMILLRLALLPAARTLGAMALVAGIVGLVGFVLFTSSAAGVPVGTAKRIARLPG